jgi:hypothetical protein
MTEPAAKVVDRGPDFAIATVGKLYVTLCRGAPRLELLEAIDRTEGAFLANVGAPIRTLFVIREIRLTGPPDAAFRTKSAALMEKYSPSLMATAQVIEGVGFGVSIMRAFVTGITLVTRTPVPTRAFADLTSSLEWLCGTGKPDPLLADRATIVRSLDAIRLQ